MSQPDAVRVVVLDVDGTLVDTNYHHVTAWFRAFRGLGAHPPLWRVHGCVGMGGDRLVAEVLGEDFEAEHGDAARAAWKEEFDRVIDQVQVLPGAKELMRSLRDAGFTVVLASSGAGEHVEHYLDLLDGRELADAWTSSDDVETTKPAPDLVGVALDAVGGGSAVMVGDSPWDALAAQRAGVPTYAVRTGGFGAEQLREAGALAVYDDLVALRADLRGSVLASPSGS
ncbi:HAD family hydrolase [Thalassiella azotivora]